MSSLDKAMQTQIDNIQKKTGRSLDELAGLIKKSGLSKHAEIREYLKRELGLGHGDANALVHAVLKSDGQRAAEGKSGDAVLDEIYSGAKANMRPIHEKLMKEIARFGEFEIAPKKGYVSLRRSKQFGLVQPSTKTRLDVGINLKGVAPTGRLEASGSFNAMVTHRVRVTAAAEIDKELVGWLKAAYEQA